MANQKNFFHNMFAGIQSWYRGHNVRKVFLITLGLALICLIIAQFDPSGISAYMAFGLGIICLGASAGDTWMGMKEFNRGIKEVERKHFLRIVEAGGTPDAKTMPAFSPEDQKVIKNRRRAYWGTFLLKGLFIVILIALIIRDSI